MATIYSLPEEIEDPPDLQDFMDDRFDFNAYEKAMDEWEEGVAAWCRANTPNPKSDLVGYVWRHPMGDGKASYAVFSTRPLGLIHLPGGDDWRLPEAHERGLRVADIRKGKKFDDFWMGKVEENKKTKQV